MLFLFSCYLLFLLLFKFAQVFHLLGNFLPHILLTHWHLGFTLAGLGSSLLSLSPALLSPCVGLLADSSGRQLEGLLYAAFATALAYSLLLLAPGVTPFLPILLLSIAVTFIPTITLALVPLCVPSDAYGLAYGTMEVLDSVGLMAGNYLFALLFKQTQSYVPGMTGLAGLSVTGIVIFTALLCLDRRGLRRGGLERSRHFYSSIPPLTSVTSTESTGSLSRPVLRDPANTTAEDTSTHSNYKL